MVAYSLLGVSLDVVRDKRAEGNDLETLPAGVFQRSGCEATAEAPALAGFVHLSVCEGDAAVSAPVGGKTDQVPAEPELVAALFRHIDDLGLGNGSLPRLELVGPAEVLDQLPRRGRWAKISRVPR